jgi:RNA polymerase sigma factor (sigma-70 family)
LSATAISGETFEQLRLQWNRWVKKLWNRMATRLDLERDDVYQELIYALIKALPRFNSQLGSFSTYASWIARSVFTRLLDRINHSPQTVDGGFPDSKGLMANLVDVLGDPDATSPSDDANRNELIQLVRREVKRLPPRCRECVCRHFGFFGLERARRTDKDREALRRGLLLLRNRIRVRPE